MLWTRYVLFKLSSIKIKLQFKFKENEIDRKALNHNTEDGAIEHDSTTASWGGTAVFGDFGLVTAGADSQNSISFEAANCNAECTDTAYAQSVERYTVTVTGITATKSD